VFWTSSDSQNAHMLISANRDSSIPKTCHELTVNTPYLPYRLGGYSSITLSHYVRCTTVTERWTHGQSN